MARRRQEGNLFFRLDVDFFSDRKVKILKARYGADGITLYLYLLWSISKKYYGTGSYANKIYEANKTIIERTAVKHGFRSSANKGVNGWWIFDGERLVIP